MSIKIITKNIFDGGLTDNQRDNTSNKLWYTENVLLEKNIVSQTVNNLTVNSKGYNPEFYVHKLLIHSDGALYGYGQENTTTVDTSLYTKTLGDSTSDWSLVTNGKIATSSSISYNPFFLSFGGDIYLTGGNGYIAKYSGTTMTANWSTTAYYMLGGLSWQGNMYGHTANKIYKVVVTAPVEMLVIPSDQTIVKLLDYGNYMAIICTNKMYLWDGVTTTTFSDIVKMGSNTAKGADILNGLIYVVSDITNGRGFNIKVYSGGIFQTVYTYRGRYNRARTKIYASIASDVKSNNGFLYFMVIGTRSDSTFTTGTGGSTGYMEMQLFRYGKTNANDETSLSCWKTFNSTGTSTNTVLIANNDFVIFENGITQAQESASVLAGLAGVSTSYYYESYSTFSTTEDTTYPASAVIETTIFNDEKSDVKKRLVGVSTTTEYMPTAGQIILKYRKDEETTWTTLFTDTTDNNISHDCVNIESTGASLPTFREIQFRIELSGNAKLTGITMKYEDLTDKPY